MNPTYRRSPGKSARRAVEKRYPAGGMPRRVEDLELAIAEIDAVPLIQPASRLRAGDAAAGVKTGRERCRVDRFRGERLPIAIRRVASAQHRRLGRVDQHVREAMAGADVVPVGVPAC
jgi:hypothetical protein